MQQPDGYQVSEKESFICRLKTSLYVLKQAPRCWNQPGSQQAKDISLRVKAST